MPCPRTPVDEFVDALHAQDVERVRALLDGHAEVRAAVNAPIGDFDSRPVHAAKKNLPLLDLLLAHGADLNLKSAWWAGGFGVLEYDCTPEEAAPLIARGAIVDVFAAAHLGMFDRVRALVDADPSLVHARGGDGKTPLHCARTVESAEYLLDRGADLDARDVDHESTAAQYLVRDAPAVTRRLVERGAWADVFIAVGLRDAALAERCLRDDPGALDHRIGRGKYRVAHDGARPAARDEIGDRRGDIYRWVFDHNIGAMDVAAMLRYDDVLARLERHATAAERLLAACARGDRPRAEAIVSADPEIVARLTPEQARTLTDRAHANDVPAVALMLDLGFDPRAIGDDSGDALHWAAFQGSAAMVRLLLEHDPAIGVRDAHYGGTALDWCLFGAVHGWAKDRGDFAATARLLRDAGERFDPVRAPTGRDDVDAVLGKD